MLLKMLCSQDYCKFLQELEIVQESYDVVDEKSSTNVLVTIPFWAKFVYEAPIGGYFREVSNSIQLEEERLLVTDQDFFWLTFLTWIVREDPELELRIESVLQLAGKEGLRVLLEDYFC